MAQSFSPFGASPVLKPAAASPFERFSIPKSKPINDRIAGLLGNFDTLGNDLTAQSTAYQNRFDSVTPQLERLNAEDQNYLASLGRNIAGDLADIRRRRAQAVNDVAEGQLADLRRSLGLGMVQQGGSRGAGLGSYLGRIAANSGGRIRTNAALDATTQERQDLDTLNRIRTGMVGQRQALADALTTRELTRNRGAEDRITNLIARLAGLLQLDQANTDYGLSMPA